MSKSYYAAANTENGFKSLFEDIFSPKALSAVYIIKGGPGTGKSTFMRTVASKALERGMQVEYYYCSADTDSLDGIKLCDIGVAFIDGTSPHAYEPRYPGACEITLDLGRNFNTEYLAANRSCIESLADECSACYARSSRFLRAAGETERLRLEVAGRAFDTEKAKMAVKRMLSQYKPEKGEYMERYISALGVHGASHITNEPCNGERTVRISGKYGCDKLFLKVLANYAVENGYTAVRYPDVLLHDCTEGVYIAEAGVRYICTEEGCDEINAMRFVKQEILAENRAKLRFAKKCKEALLQGALSELGKMGALHRELEGYYINAMDVRGNEAMMQRVISDIFGE